VSPRILLFDEQSVYRGGLHSLISSNMPRAEVVEANSLNEALSQIRNDAFNLVILGVNTPGLLLGFLKAAREASPSTQFAIISALDTREDILTTLAAGLHGFISKHQSDADILDAITYLLSGRTYVPRSLVEAGDDEASVSQGDRGAAPILSTEADLSKLTKRQREVLQLLARGMSNKEIARALKIAEATTKIHMAALLRALGARNRTEAAYKAGHLVDSTEPADAEDRPTVIKKDALT
jgi:DNA-binding NarL/FixJ family response regulator